MTKKELTILVHPLFLAALVADHCWWSDLPRPRWCWRGLNVVLSHRKGLPTITLQHCQVEVGAGAALPEVEGTQKNEIALLLSSRKE